MTKPRAALEAENEALRQEVERLRKRLGLDQPLPLRERATCAWCGDTHFRERPVRPGQRAFCARCRQNGAPVRMANRDKRARERGRVD